MVGDERLDQRFRAALDIAELLLEQRAARDVPMRLMRVAIQAAEMLSAYS